MEIAIEKGLQRILPKLCIMIEQCILSVNASGKIIPVTGIRVHSAFEGLDGKLGDDKHPCAYC